MIDCSVLCLAPSALPGNGGRGDVDPVAEYYRVSILGDKFQISLNHSYSHDITAVLTSFPHSSIPPIFMKI